MTQGIGSPWQWFAFGALVLVMLAIDLLVVHRHPHRVRPREALIASAVWISLALLFGGYLALQFGSGPAEEFFTGYVIEKSLSVDNLFIFMLLFSHFAVPPKDQHRMLFWGVLGALVMRLVFIAAGAALLHRFHIVALLFGGFLLLTAVKMLLERDREPDLSKSRVLRVLKRVAPKLPQFVVVLTVIELTDLVFAVDSIPAVFGVTDDPFIVYTSNIFAVLGLRSLYFALAGVLGRFHYLKPGLALVLAFVGAKMLLSSVVTVPILLSLGVIAFILGASVVASLLFPRRDRSRPVADT